jgi:hypothetical protein
VRRGNCRARALWAWRKLSELGFDPEFVVGVWAPSSRQQGPHAWVRYSRDGRDYLLETTERTATAMVRPLERVRVEYVPHFSVRPSGRTHVYRAFVSAMWS